MNTTSLQDAYLVMQEASGIKVGDTVRVLRKAADYEMGWGNKWVDDRMDNYIGRECRVTNVVGDRGILLEDKWAFPFFVLEKTNRFIEINGHKVPEPEQKALKYREKYWTPNIHYGERSVCYDWFGSAINDCHLRHGLVHKTKEAAEIHAKALLSLMTKSFE